MSVASEQIWFRPVRDERPNAFRIASGWTGFDRIDVLRRDKPAERLPAEAVRALWPEASETLDRITAARPAIAGVDWSQPRVMGVINATPDSFSDGGRPTGAQAAIEHGLALEAAGADILDIGGESTRPGAQPVPEDEEADRVLPVIAGLIDRGCAIPISIDTRKAGIARAALATGARIVNDVSAMTYDPGMPEAARAAEGICLMHALGDPRTMQDDPRYDDVLLDVYDYLAGRVAAAEAAGIERSRMLIDPGVGFGKTLAHNLRLIESLSLFHGLGCPVLLGVSRKGFIGRLSGETDAARRVPGSLAAGLAGVAAGAQVLRVHDVSETVQALSVWRALNEEFE